MINDEERRRLDREKLTQEEVDNLYDIIEITAKILEQQQIRYMAEGGTLLGIVRSAGLIQHDTDGDFDVLQEDLPKILSLRPLFSSYGLEVMETPGWGLKVFFLESPSMSPYMVEGKEVWTSKWPFLDLISIQWQEGNRISPGKYICAQDSARKEYPNYYLTQSDWEEPFEKLPFGHLTLNCISGIAKREAYLDRHYPGWQTKIELITDHRNSVYFSEKIICSLDADDLKPRVRSTPTPRCLSVSKPSEATLESALELRSTLGRFSLFNNLPNFSDKQGGLDPKI